MKTTPDRLDVERGACTACGHETTLRHLWTYATGVRCITSESCDLRAALRDLRAEVLRVAAALEMSWGADARNAARDLRKAVRP